MMPGTLILYARAPSVCKITCLSLRCLVAIRVQFLVLIGPGPGCHLRGQAVQVECLRSASLNHTSPLFPLKLRSACIGDHLFLAEINFVRFNVCPSSLLAKDDLVLQDPNMSCPDWSRPSPRPLCAHQAAGMAQMSLGHLPTHTTE